MDTRHTPLLKRLREHATVLGDAPRDYDPLLQLAQDRDVVLLGEATHVTAARDWDGPAERRHVLPARKGSWEHLLHASGRDRFFLPIAVDLVQPLSEPLLERAIGVLYRPESELASHYFAAALGAQFDALFHLDETSAVEPMDSSEHWEAHARPDTYPFGV